MNFTKIISSVSQAKEPQLTKRICQSGWESMGHIKREPDVRSKEQLLENIDYFAKKCPEVAQFKSELKAMNPKHIGLVSDICELATRDEMLPTAIKLNGTQFFKFLMSKLPLASKENPESLDFIQTIINNTDSQVSKYALYSFEPIYERKDAREHVKATTPLIESIAEQALQGGYQMDYSKEKGFVNALASFISPEVHLDKLKLLPEILKVAENSKAMGVIEAFPFLTNSTPVEKITKNLETFKILDNNMKNKTINLTEFLENNVNLD